MNGTTCTNAYDRKLNLIAPLSYQHRYFRKRMHMEELGNLGIFTLILNPALALVSMNMTPNSRDLESPSSIETCLFDQQYILHS